MAYVNGKFGLGTEEESKNENFDFQTLMEETFPDNWRSRSL